MTESLQDAVAAASRLRAAVEETAAALAGADLQRLLASDALLQKVLHEIPRTAALSPDDRLAVRLDTEKAQDALRRCRRLGATLTEFVRLSLDAQGQGLGYDPARAAGAGMTGRELNERA